MYVALGMPSITAKHIAKGGTGAQSLQALLALGPLLIPLLIDHSREGVLELSRNAVCDSHDASQEQTGGLSVPQRGREEAECRAVVHGRVGDVEGERGDWCVHENAEIVTEVRAGHAERPHGGQDEGVAGEEEGDRGVFDERVLEEGRDGLVGEGFVVASKKRVSIFRSVASAALAGWADVQVVPEDTQ